MIRTNISLPTVVARAEWQRTLERRRGTRAQAAFSECASSA